MKIFGETLDTANVEYIVIPRGDRPNIVFKACSILSNEEFLKLCPPPEPPKMIVKGGKMQDNVEDDGYLQRLKNQNDKYFAWLIITSLRETDGLEWETVDYADPETWTNYEKELRDAKFSFTELQQIIKGVLSANCLDEARLEKARKDFLLGINQAPKE